MVVPDHSPHAAGRARAHRIRAELAFELENMDAAKDAAAAAVGCYERLGKVNWWRQREHAFANARHAEALIELGDRPSAEAACARASQNLASLTQEPDHLDVDLTDLRATLDRISARIVES
jgi:hypothetical protein